MQAFTAIKGLVMPKLNSLQPVMRTLSLALLLGWAALASTAQAQFLRCIDAKTGEVT